MAEFAENINQGNQDDVSNTHLKVIKTNSLSAPPPPGFLELAYCWSLPVVKGKAAVGQ